MTRTYLFIPHMVRTRKRGRLTACFRGDRKPTLRGWLKEYYARRRNGGARGYSDMALTINAPRYGAARSIEACRNLPEAWRSHRRGKKHRDTDAGFENAVRVIEDKDIK